MSSNLNWSETFPGRYERSFDANETPMSALTQSTIPTFNQEHWVVNAVATLNLDEILVDDFEQKLKRAWIRLRWQAPYIATVNTGSTLAYDVADTGHLEAWLHESFHVEPNDFKALRQEIRPNRFCTLHYFPKFSQVALRVHHWLTDGPGILKCLQVLLQFLVDDEAAPSFGDEWRRLTPAWEVVLGVPEEKTLEMRQYADDMLQSFLSPQPGIGLPYKSPPVPPAISRSYRVEYSAEVSSAVPAACKRLGFGVAAAMDAALVLATQENATKGVGKDYITFSAINIRSQLLPPWNDLDSWPAGHFLISIPYALPPADYLTQARKLHEFYRQPMKRGTSLAMDAYPLYTSKLTEVAFSAPPAPDMPLPSAPQPSNMGILENFIRPEYSSNKHKLSIVDIDLTPDVTLPSMAIEQWSWRGKLNIGANYNQAWFDKDYVQAFVEHLAAVLFDNLGIQNHTVGVTSYE